MTLLVIGGLMATTAGSRAAELEPHRIQLTSGGYLFK
jgi:hypothetical protein